ncbi:cystatin-like [Crotalus adamanteus]|uniref:Cystatin-like n=1 Tax=Crotalus adamanteus TaxID=8729 RepID=A0AAW1AN75_CROAD
MPEILSNVPFTDSGVKRARAFAVHQFNKEHNGSPNYFKLLRLLTAESPVVPQVEYHLTVVLLETACEKETEDGEAVCTWAGEMGQPQGRDLWRMGMASAQPPSLSLASPMMHSQLPVPFLFCALLMLPLGVPKCLSDVPVTDVGMQTALAFAVEQYNKDRDDSANYFKQLCLLKAKSQTDPQVEYHLTVLLMKTACEKKTSRTRPYNKIQKCKKLPGDPQILCYFKVVLLTPDGPTSEEEEEEERPTEIPKHPWLELHHPDAE